MPNHELADIEFLLPFSFKQLLIWGKLRDFRQEMELEGIDGLPQHLIGFSSFLKEGQSGPLSGSGSGPLKVGARALKIKKLIAMNVITPMSSGSRQFDNATKRMDSWKPSAENVRQVDKMHF